MNQMLREIWLSSKGCEFIIDSVSWDVDEQKKFDFSSKFKYWKSKLKELIDDDPTFFVKMQKLLVLWDASMVKLREDVQSW